MSQATAKRTSLMIGCGCAALALGLALGPAPAAAQGIQASGNVTFGNATINNAVPGQTRVSVSTPTTAIDWTPQEDAAGNALDFLPAGASAIYENDSGASFVSNFAVLNRILPSTNGNVAVINGSVISRIVQFSGTSAPGGFVAFYSPTGILIGSTASFDVGQLLLTTLDTTPASFESFAQSGFGLQLQGAAGSTARISIAPGAQILATPENAFFAVVAADVEMRGVARVNGSHAYVAGELVNLSFNNGLFNIQVPVGTAAAGEVVTIDGTVGGPSSTGAINDNHLIYAVARASQDPISMLLRGNLGFDPAQSAGIVNGEIILAANYNVSGRIVDGSSISEGIDARFNGNSELSNVRADIAITDAAVSSSLLAIGTHRVSASALGADSSYAGNLLLVGRESASLTAAGGNDLTISGDVLVDARDYGVTGSGLQSLDVINAAAGTALIEANAGSAITVAGAAFVQADAFGGADTIGRIAGTARGGSAAISANGGSIDITGETSVSASASGTNFPGIITGAEARGGSAEVRARAGGVVSVGQDLAVFANALGAEGSLSGPSTVSDAYGGTARISLFDGGGTITVAGPAFVGAGATSRSVNAAGAGAIADAGEATVSVQESGLIDFGSDLVLDATARGGTNAGGIGGEARGGRASALVLNGGTITVAGEFDADSFAAGGDGQTGGDAFGGIAGAIVNVGRIDIALSAFAGSQAQGGSASAGFGGNGGLARGGSSIFEAGGTLTQTARLTIGGDATLVADATGGSGGGAFIQTNTPAGRGGDAFGGAAAVPNQADPASISGAFLRAGGDNGTISVAGSASVSASASGGSGGFGDSTLDGGAGGNAIGGLVEVGLALLGQNGSLGQGRASFGSVFANADAFGGGGGLTFDFATGNGGEGSGGTALLSLHAGDVTATTIELSASGSGGSGRVGGIGRGGQAEVLGSLGGTLVTSGLGIRSTGFGGFSTLDTGGEGVGGVAEMEIDGTTITINGDLLIEADGSGGGSLGGAGGNGLGGEAYIGQVGVGGPGVLNVTGHTALFANGQGGDSEGAFAAGDGQGGHAWIRSAAGATKTFGSVQLTAIGRGGFAQSHEGGNGTGGLVELISTGTGSRITIARNVPADSASDSPGGTAILNAGGFGEQTSGGDGIGGLGRGGTILVSAALGGVVNLPVDILADPARAADALIVLANGTGGGSSVEGGIGGSGFGGLLSVVVDGAGSSITAGDVDLQALGFGGSGIDPGVNTQGGSASGGRHSMTVQDGGSLTLGQSSARTGALGGDGSGTGNGGNALGGNNVVRLNNATLTVTGVLGLSDTATGGNGQRGGDSFSAGEGGSVDFSATDSTIVVNLDGQGLGGIALESAATGGAGVTGGDAFSGSAGFSLLNSDINQGILRVISRATGGSTTSSNGAGGNAASGLARVTIDSATVFLSELVVAADAVGGDGGTEIGGLGGEGRGGTADVVLSNAALSVQPVTATGTDSAQIRAEGFAGRGFNLGNGAGGRAALRLFGATLDTAQLRVSAEGSALGESGQISGAASGGEALLALDDGAGLTAAIITVSGSAGSGQGGSSTGGFSALRMGSGGASSINAGTLFVTADGFGASVFTLADFAGRFDVDLAGGNVNLNEFFARANGTLLVPDTLASRISAVGGNLNVAGQLAANALGDITIEHGSSGTIGSSALAQVATTILVDTAGTLRIQGIVPSGGGNQSASGATGGIRGQFVDLLAGRSIFLDGNVTGTDGGISLIANRGGFPLPQPPLSEITMATGARIDGGTGTVSFVLQDGFSDPQRQTGAITLANVTASSIVARNFGSTAGSDIRVLADGVLTASGSGRAIDLASLNGEVINLHGDAGLILTGGGHFGIFAATPTGSQIGSPGNFARRYNVLTETAYDALNPGGNFAAFRITPVLTVTVDDIARFYGSANPAFTTTITGFLTGDSIADITGAAQFATLADGTSPIGQYAVNASLGSLLSAQGYQFSFAPGVLTVTPRPITITANSFSRIYGNANPALTFVVGGQGLVNGDQLTGVLATTAGLTSGVGNYAITQGSLAASANYAVTFVDGQLTVTPRPITITADSFSRIYGNANPGLTFALGGLGLVNGDQLSGALATTAGLTSGVGAYAITQGSLTAGANYAVTYNAGAITVTARPITITADSFTRVYGNANPALTFSIGGLGLVNGDQLSGALAAAGVTAGVGTSAITLGTLSAGGNYAVTFTPGVLTITPRPLTVAANNLSKPLGLADPVLTFSIIAGDLVNGDLLSGSLVRDPGETIASFAIRQGTLAASANYTLTFVPGTFTITPPPVSPDINNPTSFEPPLVIDDTPPPVAGEDEERFGIDFPERPDAPLISEDPLLDDPVASGGDSSIYGGGGAAAPTTGGQ